MVQRVDELDRYGSVDETSVGTSLVAIFAVCIFIWTRTIAANTSLEDIPATVIEKLRSAITKLGNLDSITADICIGVTAPLEKHLWMLQAEEL